ncbi:NAD(P)-binding domain,Short-chain dehydrogenase/reductase SDR [Cinara cedri]|uniref:NAD(P)-binding domain,Short-chain dehydrogenase/reductase SDR n=1 Tax=Cinara cedri TaxID=506608 RepID=A0A5E4NQC9_9HEMI|nr:NAD(P)-binding domain,Short-chain dehydrogenase/reductase SDR [Cinara cedri]
MEYVLPNRCKSEVRLDGKTVIVTGSNTGIGKETAMEFYRRGARVIMACRNSSRAQTAIESIKQKTEGEKDVGELVFKHLELSFWASVRTCAKEILHTEKRIDILVNNAGIMMCPKSLSENGIELHLATNHLGHFLFTLLLLPRILKSAPARIINVTSLAHKWGDKKMHFDDINLDKNYTPSGAYGRSKLANILFTVELAKRLNGTGVTVYAVNPGVVHTELGRFMDESLFLGASWLYNSLTKLVVKTPEQGAQTTLHCALDHNCSNESGLYYSDCKVIEPETAAKDEKVSRELWDTSCTIVHLEPEYDPFKPEEDVQI